MTTAVGSAPVDHEPVARNLLAASTSNAAIWITVGDPLRVPVDRTGRHLLPSRLFCARPRRCRRPPRSGRVPAWTCREGARTPHSIPSSRTSLSGTTSAMRASTVSSPSRRSRERDEQDEDERSTAPARRAARPGRDRPHGPATEHLPPGPTRMIRGPLARRIVEPDLLARRADGRPRSSSSAHSAAPSRSSSPTTRGARRQIAATTRSMSWCMPGSGRTSSP